MCMGSRCVFWSLFFWKSYFPFSAKLPVFGLARRGRKARQVSSSHIAKINLKHELSFYDIVWLKPKSLKNHSKTFKKNIWTYETISRQWAKDEGIVSEWFNWTATHLKAWKFWTALEKTSLENEVTLMPRFIWKLRLACFPFVHFLQWIHQKLWIHHNSSSKALSVKCFNRTLWKWFIWWVYLLYWSLYCVTPFCPRYNP